MTGFSPYGVSVGSVVDQELIVLKIDGSQAYPSGDYMNERNVTQNVRINPETAREIIEDLERALEEVEE